MAAWAVTSVSFSLASKATVELVDISKNFGAIAALRSISLTVRKGEFISLLGPSGCGKTTLLRIIAGLEQPSSGGIKILGSRVDALPPYLRNIGMVFQQYALFPHKSVRKNIEFGLRYRTQLGRSEREDEIKRALALVRLPEYEQRRPHQLSGGEQQRIALARAIVTRPDVLLLDEPLSNLDAKLRDEMRIEIKDIHRTLGITFIYVTHDRREALTMSDRVVVMRAGRIEQIGSAQEVYERPMTRHVAQFMGHGNILPATVVGATPEGPQLRLADGTEVDARGPTGLTSGILVDLVIRSDSLTIHAEQSIAASARERTFPAVARTVLYSGSFLDLHLTLDDGTVLRAEVPNDGRVALVTGQRVFLSIRPHGTWVLARQEEGKSGV
jgi:ABC-type Fe3+/spermidine/putrescine transport system ATPase subunit